MLVTALRIPEDTNAWCLEYQIAMQRLRPSSRTLGDYVATVVRRLFTIVPPQASNSCITADVAKIFTSAQNLKPQKVPVPHGVPSEVLWAYIESNLDVARRPVPPMLLQRRVPL